LRGEFAEMRGEEIVPAVALQFLILQIHFNLLLKIVRGFPKRGAEQRAVFNCVSDSAIPVSVVD
jgi:hypothetical protein